MSNVLNSKKNFAFNTEYKIHFKSIVCPENEPDFHYLSKYLKVRTISDENKKEALLREEEFIDWILKVFKQNDVRFFLALENFFRAFRFMKEFYQEEEFLKKTLYYIDMCRDDIQIFRSLLNIPQFKKNCSLYEYLALVYEKNHDFKSADETFKEGFDNRVDDLQSLEKKYKSFEERMESRIERDLNNSEINAEVIKSHLLFELEKKAQKISGFMNNISLGAKRNYNELSLNNQFLYNENGKMNELINKEIQSNFNFLRVNNASPFHKVKEPSIDLLNDRNFNYAGKKQKIEIIKEIIEDPNLPLNCYTYYGQIPIYVDLPNRDKIITKAGKLVEIHGIISNFLLQHDEKYKTLNAEFEAKLKDDMTKKPFSLLQVDRDIRDKAEKISLKSLEDNNNIINGNDSNKNLNALINENIKLGQKENRILKYEDRKLKAEPIKNKENNNKNKTDKEIDSNNFEKKLIKQYNPSGNNITENFLLNKLNDKEKQDQIEKDSLIKEKNNIDLIINDLIKIPKIKEKDLDQKLKREPEKQDEPIEPKNQEINSDPKVDLPIKELENKVKFVKAEKSNVIKNINVFDIKKRLDNDQKKFLSITQYLINGHHAMLKKMREEEELKEKAKLLLEENLNKTKKANASKMSRKTEILLVDSDGDVIVGTEDELDKYFTESSQKHTPDEKESKTAACENFNIEKSSNFYKAAENFLPKNDSSLNNLHKENQMNQVDFCHPTNKDFKINYKLDYNGREMKDIGDNYEGISIEGNVVFEFLEEPKNIILEAFKKSIININNISDAITLVETLHNNKRIDAENKAKYIQKLENLLDMFITNDHGNPEITNNEESYTIKLSKEINNLIDESKISNFDKNQNHNLSQNLNLIENKKGKNFFQINYHLAKEQVSNIFEEDLRRQNEFITNVYKEKNNSIGLEYNYKKDFQKENLNFDESDSFNSLDKHTNTPDRREKFFSRIIGNANGIKLNREGDLIDKNAKFQHPQNYVKNKNININTTNQDDSKSDKNKQNPRVMNANDPIFSFFNNPEKHPKNNSKQTLDVPVNETLEKQIIHKDNKADDFSNVIELKHNEQINDIFRPQIGNKLNRENKTKLINNFQEEKNEKTNHIKDNPIKQMKLNQKEFSEDGFWGNQNFQKDKVNKNKHVDLFFKANEPQITMQSQINDKYIFDTSKDKMNFKGYSDSSDIDRMISDIDKKDVKYNLFGKPFLNKQITEAKKQAHDLNKKDNVNHRINANSKLDLSQIFGDCTNNPHN